MFYWRTVTYSLTGISVGAWGALCTWCAGEALSNAKPLETLTPIYASLLPLDNKFSTEVFFPTEFLYV